LEQAVELMEKGTEKLLANPGEDAMVPLQKVLHNLNGMHALVKQLRGRYMADVVHLQAEVDRQQAEAAAAKRDSAMSTEEKVKVQSSMHATDMEWCNQELQRKAWNYSMEVRNLQHTLSQECATARAKDAEQLANMTQQAEGCSKALDESHFELERAKADLHDRDAALEELQNRAHGLEDEKNLVVLERQNLEQNVTATRRQWEEDKQYQQKVLSEMKDQVDDLEEEVGQLRPQNRDLKKELQAERETVAKLKKELAALGEDKAALLDSMRAFIRGDHKPATHMLAAAESSMSTGSSVRFSEVWKKTADIDSYLKHSNARSSPTTTTTLPHVKAKALAEVFGAQAPELVKVALPAVTTTKKALQKFLDTEKMLQGDSDAAAAAAAMRNRTSNSKAHHKSHAKAPKAKPADHHKAGLIKQEQQLRAGAAATAPTPSAEPNWRNWRENKRQAALAAADAAVARAKGTLAKQLEKAAGEVTGQWHDQWHAQVTANAQSSEAMRQSFGEADKTLEGSEQTSWEQSSPDIAPPPVTDASLAATGSMAMKDLFSEADRLMSSAVEG
jgi:predicted nuclease with TOPRIM domain